MEPPGKWTESTNMARNPGQEEWGKTLERLQAEVSARLAGEERPEPSLMARLARDYRSWARMGHPPERAVHLARQLRFQNREYTEDREGQLALRITEMLAEIYERELESGPGGATDT